MLLTARFQFCTTNSWFNLKTCIKSDLKNKKRKGFSVSKTFHESGLGRQVLFLVEFKSRNTFTPADDSFYCNVYLMLTCLDFTDI